MAVNSIITHTYDLTAPLGVTPLRHHLVSGDSMGDRFEITVTQEGRPVSLAGGSVMGYFIREGDGATVPIPGQASGSVASLLLPEACYAVPGRFTLTVKVTVGDAPHAVYACEGAVLRSSTDALVDPGHVIPDINELLAMIGQIEAATSAAKEATGKATSAASAADAAKASADKATAAANDAAATANKWSNVTATVTMLAADQSAAVTLTDTTNGKTIAFKLPRGLTGLTPNLKIGTVRTGAPGTDVIATITGSAENPVLNLTIPRGDVGSIGSLTINGKSPDGSGRVTLVPADIGAVARTGDTMTGNLTVNSGNPMVNAQNTDTGEGIRLTTSAAGNSGLYDIKNLKWILQKQKDDGPVRLYGNTDTATKLETPRKLNGVAFDGSKDITVPADPWKAGDTITFGAMGLNGYVTSSAASIYVTVNVGKPISASSAAITAFTGELRSAKGYIDGSGTKDILANYTVSVSSMHKDTGNIVILIQKSSAFEGVDNNTPVSLRATALSIKFS